MRNTYSHWRTDLKAIKAVHTTIWIVVEACMVYLLVSGSRGRSDGKAATAGAVVIAESIVFLANGARCPLSDWAESLGDDRGSVTDIYLPRWMARSLPAIHIPLVLLAAVLHGRNLIRDRSRA